MALPEHLLAKAPASWNAEPIRRPLTSTAQEAAPHQERAALRGAGCVDNHGVAVSVHQLAQRLRIAPHNRSKHCVRQELRRQLVDKGRRQKAIVGRDRWCSLRSCSRPCPQSQLRPCQIHKHTGTPGDDTHPHRGSGELRPPPPARGGSATRNVAAATRRVEARPSRTAARSADGGESLPWREKCCC